MLDTNAVSELFKARPDRGLLGFVAEREDELAITSVTVTEIADGIGILAEGRRRASLTAAFLDFTEALAPTSILELDEAAARRAGQFQAQRRLAGHPLALADALIAGIVALRGMSLVTRNAKDFAGLGLDVVTPWRDTVG